MSAVITPYRVCNRCEDFNVGYAPAALQKNGLTAGACFIPVSGTGVIDLTDLTVTGYEGESKSKVEIQTLDAFGRTVNSYYWYDYTNKSGQHIVGWLDDDDALVEKGVVTFQAGEGLWVNCAAAGFNLQSSGQVPTATVTVELQKNGLSVVNPTPVTVDLTKCIITGYTGESKSKVEVQTLDSFGRTVTSCYWYDYYTKKSGQHIVGWLDDNDALLEEDVVTVNPGTGLWTNCAADGFNFVWPGVVVD